MIPLAPCLQTKASWPDTREHLEERHIDLHLVGIKLPVEAVLQRAGHLNAGPRLHLYRTEAEALRAAGALSPATA